MAYEQTAPRSKQQMYALAAVLGIGGAAILLLALSGAGGEAEDSLVNGGTMEKPHSSLDDSPVIKVSLASWADGKIGNIVKASLPWVFYDGPGQNTYTYLRVVQNNITVMGSGVAGIWVGPSNERGGCDTPPCPTADKKYALVAPNQPQPNPDQSCPQWGQTNTGSWLDAWMFPGPWCIDAGQKRFPTPICNGQYPRIGAADVYLEIYQKKYPNDVDGFAAPICGAGRKVCRRTVYKNKVDFIA